MPATGVMKEPRNPSLTRKNNIRQSFENTEMSLRPDMGHKGIEMKAWRPQRGDAESKIYLKHPGAAIRDEAGS